MAAQWDEEQKLEERYRIRKWGEDCWARIVSFFREYNLQRLQCREGVSAEEEELKQQKRMEIMKNLTRKIRSKGMMDAENRWWVVELLAEDCERAWIHPGWEDMMRKWYEWLEWKKKNDEKEQMKDMHQQKSGSDDQECRRKCGSLAQG